ncbi:MAG: hypothetical protein HY975_03870 [Candidatus Kerfeldbacteria bacterium]|nr:hypothetical protein [Candidatus Kerfeldbacteria bacterium]
MSNWEKIGIGIGGLVVVTLLGFWIFWANWMHFVDKHEFGYVFDRFTGVVTVVDHSGWVMRNPIRYTVNKIDLRPYQVSITADLGVSQRILNAKLVRFNPAGLNTFIAWHGRGAGGNVDALKEILKCYAFDREEGRDCPFLVVVSDIAPSQTFDSGGSK